MLVDAALGFLNHLLTGETWARDRLKPFAGQSARLEFGALTLPVEVTGGGYFKAGGSRQTPAVTITLPPDTLIRALTDRPSLFAAAHISGSAEFAENLGFIFRNLDWDVESDLSSLIGDIAARRVVQGGKQLASWQWTQARNLATNVAEYFTEEKPGIARRQDVSAYCAEVEALQSQLLRLELRIAALEG